MMLPLPNLLLRPIMSIAIVLLQARDKCLAMASDAGDVLVRQPVPEKLHMPPKLLPVGLDVTPTHDHLLEVCWKQTT
jgi:hypothetical protein